MRDRRSLFEQLQYSFFVIDQPLQLDPAADRSSDAYPLRFFERQRLFRAQRDQIVFDFRHQPESERQHLAIDIVIERIAVLGAVNHDLFFHADIEDRHNIQQRAAQAREFGNDQRIPLFEFSDQQSQPSFVAFGFSADHLRDPLVDFDAPRFREPGDFQLLVFEMLFFSADSQVCDNHDKKELGT